jgi:molybdopterin molybdotransferase
MMTGQSGSVVRVKTREEALAALAAFEPLPPERVRLESAWGRVLAEAVTATGESLTGDRSAGGEVLLPEGRRLGPQDVGVLASLGISQVLVHRRPRVAVLSTGDEVVPVELAPGPGQVRDVNSYALAAQAARGGAEVMTLGLVGDDPGALRRAVVRGLEGAEVVLVSGGSSAGRRDRTLETLLSLPGGELLIRGVAISPGRQTMLVRLGQRAAWGLSGRVSGSMVAFDLLVRPLLARLGGERPPDDEFHPALTARLGSGLSGAAERERYFQVRLELTGQGPVAWPIRRASGSLADLIEADGLIRVPRGGELTRDQEVEVRLWA